MSLSLSRRVARAALLIAAGAAPLVGAAGAASALELPKANDLGGLTNPGGTSLGHEVNQTAKTAAPGAARSASTVAGQTARAVGRTTGTASGMLNRAVRGGGLPGAGGVLQIGRAHV